MFYVIPRYKYSLRLNKTEAKLVVLIANENNISLQDAYYCYITNRLGFRKLKSLEKSIEGIDFPTEYIDKVYLIMRKELKSRGEEIFRYVAVSVIATLMLTIGSIYSNEPTPTSTQYPDTNVTNLSE